MVEATSDAQGHFVLQTQSGYATEIDAVSADERLRGTVSVPSRSTEGIVVAVKPVLQATLFNGEFDPKTVRGRQVGFAVEHLINYLSAHPREPLHSLRTYTERNVISSEQLAYFTQSPNLFLSSNAQVNYVWGKQALIFSSVEAPISFGVTPLMQRAGFSPSSR